MSTTGRLFEPPAADGEKIKARLYNLPPQLRALVERAGNALATDDVHAAQRALVDALAQAPSQPDALRLYGLLLARIGNLRAAAMTFEAALRAAPDDAMGFWQFARACEEAGDIAAALRLREEAVRQLPASPLAWSDLGDHLSRHRQADGARVALEQAIRRAPDYAPARLALGDVLVMLGRANEGAAAMRQAIAIEPAYGDAWLSLVDIKTVAVSDDEIGHLEALMLDARIPAIERTAVEFALANVYEDRGRHAEAFDLFVDANARRKREVNVWNSEAFLDRECRVEKVFADVHPDAGDPSLGDEIIFIAGLPRSGTTLVEQILAAHPQVQGAGELGELAQVLREESVRLRQQYPEWVPQATTQDWRRLGLRYLELTSGFRHRRAHSTDKLPNNWQALGAIRAMLPGAHIILCRRDPLENCWSCFKQYFARGWEFTNDMQHLGIFWRSFDRAASWWAVRAPRHVRQQVYENLVSDTEAEIRALLEFCGLPFDPACLAFQHAEREVHTLSAAQVRQPMQASIRAAAYGPLLDPLRKSLALPPAEAQTLAAVRNLAESAQQ